MSNPTAEPAFSPYLYLLLSLSPPSIRAGYFFSALLPSASWRARANTGAVCNAIAGIENRLLHLPHFLASDRRRITGTENPSRVVRVGGLQSRSSPRLLPPRPRLPPLLLNSGGTRIRGEDAETPLSGNVVVIPRTRWEGVPGLDASICSHSPLDG